jgi:hypothetical protein
MLSVFDVDDLCQSIHQVVTTITKLKIHDPEEHDLHREAA